MAADLVGTGIAFGGRWRGFCLAGLPVAPRRHNHPSQFEICRFRVRDLVSNPERLNDVIGEIAMGRSILEG